MCFAQRELQRDMITYDVIRFIGNELGFDMVDILDISTINPLSVVTPEVDEEDILSIHYDMTTTEYYSDEGYQSDEESDDDSIIDMTLECDEDNHSFDFDFFYTD